MKYRILALALLVPVQACAASSTQAAPPAAAAPAAAQEASGPAFVPYMINETDQKQLATFLVQQPYSLAAPLMSFLQQKEQAAQQVAVPHQKP